MEDPEVSMSSNGFTIRQIGTPDIPSAALLHSQVLAEEFVARAGTRFLRAYYRAWMSTGAAIALVATGPRGEVAGILL
ncbi:MAG: hypothetical protein ACYDB3_12320, partial [Acidimicrobiales bacterium]